MLIVACVFGGLGCAAMLLTAYFQWRTVNRLTEISAALPALHGGESLLALAGGDTGRITVGPADQSNQRLLGALGQLEKRIFELEHDHRPRVEALFRPRHLPAPSPRKVLTPLQIVPAAGQGTRRCFLNLDQNARRPSRPSTRFWRWDGNHPQALVEKRRAALERLQLDGEPSPVTTAPSRRTIR